jgi:hypothetical protein
VGGDALPPAFKPGDAVLVSGLQRAPQHNGKEGVVLDYVEDTERYRVKLAGSSRDAKPLGLRASNLLPLPASFAAGGTELDEPTVGSESTGIDMSFEDILLAMKEEDAEIERQHRHNIRSKKKAAVVAAQDKQEWEGVDESVVEFQRACEAHAALWANVDKLTPVRDEWHTKWEECEAMAHKELSLETKMEHAAGKSKKPTGCASCAATLTFLAPLTLLINRTSLPSMCACTEENTLRKLESSGRQRDG